jgi:hypothetical protein
MSRPCVLLVAALTCSPEIDTSDIARPSFISAKRARVYCGVARASVRLADAWPLAGALHD